MKSPAHLRWVRSLPCCVPGCHVAIGVHAHHVRSASVAGTGMKPSDRWAVPLCSEHHSEGHLMGWMTFEAHYKLDLTGIARLLAQTSPAIGDDTAKYFL
jgi:hypothetical protein